MAPKRKNPTTPKKVSKESVSRQLVNEDSDYEDEEPLLRWKKKRTSPKTPPPPKPIEVEDTDDTVVTTSSEQASEEQGLKHTEQDSKSIEQEVETEDSERPAVEETESESSSLEQQGDKDSPVRGTLVKYKNLEVRNNVRWKIPGSKMIYLDGLCKTDR